MSVSVTLPRRFEGRADVLNPTEYIRSINRQMREGGTSEHALRGFLVDHMRQISTHLTIINEPKSTDFGNPDIAVLRDGISIGWIETKILGTNLDEFEHGDQFDRYIRGFASLLVTNYNEFRWYIDHNRTPFMRGKLGSTSPVGITASQTPDDLSQVARLLESFARYEPRQVRSDVELTLRLATFAIAICDTVTGILKRRDHDSNIRQELDAFKSVLIPNLSEDDFADMYAQTIAYGLFAARCMHPTAEQFDRMSAPHLLPISNPFLRNVFGNLAGVNLDPRVSSMVDQICLLLRTADVEAIVQEFENRTGARDPVVHFYETFLQTYDSETRRERGVYYTPLPVVSFIVRSVDQILQSRFGIPRGLADDSRITFEDVQYHRVQVLDPATGTGTFLLSLIDLIRERFENQGGLWSAYVHQSLLPRMLGFEILMAPYAICHLKLGLALAGQGFQFEQDERLNVFLTNSLENTTRAVSQLPFQTFLSREAAEANRIKQTRPIMVVFANPPYSVKSANLGPNARRLVERYAEIDGVPIREGGTLALQRSLENDYVKFIAFAQEQIERNGEGVIGFITANGYLEQPTLAGLRRSLMTTFDEIHVIDLHGYARAGANDENVFTQIGEGVAIILLVRRSASESHEAQVRYSSSIGPRRAKYEWLGGNTSETIASEILSPEAPDYRFKPEDQVVRARYRREFVELTEIFHLQKGAIVTARDKFAIAFSRQELLDRLEGFRDSRRTIKEASDDAGLAWKGDWPDMANAAREWLRQTRDLASYIEPITYRPFDDRYVIYSDKFLDTPCSAVMDHVRSRLAPNRLLLFGRTVRYGLPDQFFVTAKLAEAKSAEASKQCHAAPLYLQHDDLGSGRSTNFRPQFLDRAQRQWRGALSDELVFGYVYGILNSNLFRQKYAVQLCAGYARIPLLPLDIATQIASLGVRLVNLHVGAVIVDPVTTFPVDAQECRVGEIRTSKRWQEGSSGWRFYLNTEQFIDEIPDSVRTLRIGGYPVLDKWMGARVGNTLPVEDVFGLQRNIAAMHQGIGVVAEIDQILETIADL